MDNRVSGSMRAAAAFLCAALLLSCASVKEERALRGYVLPEVGAEAPGEVEAPVERPEIPEGPIAVTVGEAALLALQNNRAFAVQLYTPPIFETFVAQERAVYDPVLFGQAAYDRERAQRSAAGDGFLSETLSGIIGVDWFLPTGTSVDLTGASRRDESSVVDPLAETRTGLTVTQALLRGFGTDVNLADLRQAGIDERISRYELRGVAEDLVANVETTYWNYVLAGRRIEILLESLRLAEQQFDETRERVRVGRLAETELAAAAAEVARRTETLINARSNLATTRLELLRLMNPDVPDLWEREIIAESAPEPPAQDLDEVEAHVAVAMRMRPELNQARLLIDSNELEIIQTRNGLLPILDVFVTLGKTGYAQTFWRSVEDLPGDGHDLTVGALARYPLGNRAARARFARSVLTRNQSIEALANLRQLVQVDVRSAYVEVLRAREQIAATAVTRKLQEESLRAETEKFRVGRSTAILVAQAQRDLLVSQLTEVEAVVSYTRALVDLYRLEGSLLARRGIRAPGREPVSNEVAVAPPAPEAVE